MCFTSEKKQKAWWLVSESGSHLAIDFFSQKNPHSITSSRLKPQYFIGDVTNYPKRQNVAVWIRRRLSVNRVT